MTAQPLTGTAPASGDLKSPPLPEKEKRMGSSPDSLSQAEAHYKSQPETWNMRLLNTAAARPGTPATKPASVPWRQ